MLVTIEFSQLSFFFKGAIVSFSISVSSPSFVSAGFVFFFRFSCSLQRSLLLVLHCFCSSASALPSSILPYIFFILVCSEFLPLRIFCSFSLSLHHSSLTSFLQLHFSSFLLRSFITSFFLYSTHLPSFTVKLSMPLVVLLLRLEE